MRAMQVRYDGYRTAPGILGLAMTVCAHFAQVTTRFRVGPVQGLVDGEQMGDVFTVVYPLIDARAADCGTAIGTAHQLVVPVDTVSDVFSGLNSI